MHIVLHELTLPSHGLLIYCWLFPAHCTSVVSPRLLHLDELDASSPLSRALPTVTATIVMAGGRTAGTRLKCAQTGAHRQQAASVHCRRCSSSRRDGRQAATVHTPWVLPV